MFQYEKKIFLLVQVKNKLHEGRTEHAFILGSMDCTVASKIYQRWALSPISVISNIGLSLISEVPISD
jgi:hypothetical protein